MGLDKVLFEFRSIFIIARSSHGLYRNMWTQLGDNVTTTVCVEAGIGIERAGKGGGVHIIVGGHQMPAGRGTKGIDREWVEQLLLFITEPTEKVFGITKHTGLNS